MKVEKQCYVQGFSNHSIAGILSTQRQHKQKIFKLECLIQYIRNSDLNMKISIDTKDDSHEDIRKVIKMLQNLVGESQEVFTNDPQVASQEASPFTNIFGDTETTQQATTEATETTETTQQVPKEETSESTEDLFAELFSEEELKNMDKADIKKDEEKEEIKSRGKKYSIELY